jgi:hypothetical protein
LTYFRGSELQNYFTKVLEDDLKTVIKPQYVDQIPKAVKGTVTDMLKKKSELGNEEDMIKILGIYVIYLVTNRFSNYLIINQIWVTSKNEILKTYLVESFNVLPAQ